MFEPAVRGRRPLRMSIDGPPKSGKTYTALRFAHTLAAPHEIAVIDTENHSAELYLGENPDGIPWSWKVCALEHFAPKNYTQAIRAAAAQSFKVIVIDSLSHAWVGVGGSLAQVDQLKAREKSSFFAWRHVTPEHDEMINAMIYSPCHVIATMRKKMEYVIEMDSHGRQVPRRVGLAPVQREGMEYEFDVILDMDCDNRMTVAGTRCPLINGQVVVKPAASFMDPIKEWLAKGSQGALRPEPTFASPQPAHVPAPSAPAPAPIQVDTVERCSAELAAEIKKLAAEAGVSLDRIKAAITIHGASRLVDLPAEEARLLRSHLVKLHLAAEGKAAFG